MTTTRTSSTRIAALLSLFILSPSVAAHSWIEWASKIAPNGTMVGAQGFARGYVPRNSTNPPFTDTIPTNILPVSGQPGFDGSEILNKFPYTDTPQFPMLEAAPGDYVAIIHLENGHTTLPENQPLKPRNRGTVYFYGTTQPKEQEKLFDVHLLWNRDGTGGDKRGRLLGTRNYDDGQCYQPNPSELAVDRSSRLASEGALPDQELACQSDLQLPKDLKPGSVYTIYWYWDWPDLNADAIDLDKTKDGLYPWAGTFMRGEKDPNGFTMDAIAKNESYSSVIDIKITGESVSGFNAKTQNIGTEFIAKQDIYSKAIREQMTSNFQVDVRVGGGDGGSNDGPAPSETTPAGNDGGTGGDKTVTVTKLKTVPPTTVVKTVFKTIPAESAPTSSDTLDVDQPRSTATVIVTETQTGSDPKSTATVVITKTTTRGNDVTQSTPVNSSITGDGTAVIVTAEPATSGVRPGVTPIANMRRQHWGFGGL